MNVTIAEKIRFYYGFIYLWHKENGLLNLEIMKSNNNEGFSERTREYLTIVENLPHPSKAELEEIYEVAHSVRSGMLERNYCEKYLIDLCLGEVAWKIFELKKGIDTVPKRYDFTKVKSKEKYIYQANEYWQEAMVAYQDFPNNDERHIGGRIALIDTNWEFQKESGLNERVLFRDLEELNFVEVTETDTLNRLVEDEQISIISIKIK
jgi:hypothetical protein